jgi:hypothetical protein
VRRLVIVLTASVLLLAGCGQSGAPLTKAEYQAKLHQTSADLAKQISGTSSNFDTLTERDLTQIFWALKNFAAQVRAIHPPDEVGDLNAQLAGAIDDLADEFPGLARTLKRTKDPKEAIAALFGAKAIVELDQLDHAFKSRGYNLGLNG